MSTKYLNGENIARKVYDPSTESIRTTAVATFADGQIDLEISDTTDSIKIGNGEGDYLAINNDGSINTTITGDVSIEISAADGDNIAIVGTEDGSLSGTQRVAKIDSSGDLAVYDDRALKSKAIDVEFDEIEVTAKNSDGNPETIVIKNLMSVVRTLTIEYDSDGDFQRLVKS